MANQTSTASTSSSTVQNQSAITWYAYGRALPPGFFKDKFGSMALHQVRDSMPNLVPTTYEAAKAYLHEEFKKPKEQQYLRREMCMMVPVSLPKDRKVYFVVSSMEYVIEIVEGSILALPTVEVPPDSFGSPGEMGILNSKKGVVGNVLIYDPPTNIPQKGSIVLSYLTMSRPALPFTGDCIQLNHTPYK